jgi:hypothetical protein
MTKPKPKPLPNDPGPHVDEPGVTQAETDKVVPPGFTPPPPRP